MTVDRLCLCFDYHSDNYQSFSFLFKMLFISLFIKLTHIQVFNKRMHEARIKYLVYKQIAFFHLMFCMFRYSYNNVSSISTLQE